MNYPTANYRQTSQHTDVKQELASQNSLRVDAIITEAVESEDAIPAGMDATTATYLQTMFEKQKGNLLALSEYHWAKVLESTTPCFYCEVSSTTADDGQGGLLWARPRANPVPGVPGTRPARRRGRACQP